MAAVEPFALGGESVAPGTRKTIELALPQLFTHTPLRLPVHVVHGRRPGPRLMVSAAVHGDELNGVEVVRRVLARRSIGSLRGTLVAVPMVNVFGVLHHSRYLPDGRDLNRSFPGSQGGSTASRIADIFMREVVSCCTHGIDLHTASGHRVNLPQIRADLEDDETLRLAKAFGAPVAIHSKVRDGSLRGAASELGVPLLLYEAGERLRFGEVAVSAGVRGVVGVMRALGMLGTTRARERMTPALAQSSRWVRAPISGLVSDSVPLGAHVSEGDVLANVSDPFGELTEPVLSTAGGIVIGLSQIPLVHEGDALYHIARFEKSEEAAEVVEAFAEDFGSDGGSWAG